MRGIPQIQYNTGSYGRVPFYKTRPCMNFHKFGSNNSGQVPSRSQADCELALKCGMLYIGLVASVSGLFTGSQILLKIEIVAFLPEVLGANDVKAFDKKPLDILIHSGHNSRAEILNTRPTEP